MKSIITSVLPYLCEKIVSGDCKILVKKSVPKEVPFKNYIYCTKMKNKWSLCDYEGAYQNSEGEIVYAQQHVIGEFICDKVYKIEPIFSFYDSYSGYDDTSDCSYFEDYSIDNERLKKTCLTRQELYIYGKHKTLYGWHISDLKIYDKPKPIMQFYKPCPIKIKNCPGCELYSTYTGCCMNNIDRPPQSWQYVEEIKTR